MEKTFPNVSISVWPSNKTLANEIGIPAIIEYSPYQEVRNVDLGTVNLPKCSYCSAYVNSTFFVSKTKSSQCPYCGNDFVPIKNCVSSPYANFKVDTKIDHFLFYLCFIIDLDCSNDNLALSKEYFFQATQSITPGTKFFLAFIKNNIFHFVVMLYNNPKIISLNLENSLFDRIHIQSLTNNVNDLPYLNDFIKSNFKASSITDIHEIVDFSSLFSKCPGNAFIKFIMFSSNYVSNRCSSLLSFDWISPLINDRVKNIDGFYLNPIDVDNMNLQIKAMVSRYTSSPICANVSIQVFAAKQLDISPSIILTKPAIYEESSFLFTFSFPRQFSMKEFPIQFVSKYIIIYPNDNDQSSDKNDNSYHFTLKAVQRLQVHSFVFPASKDVLPILRTVNPVVLKRSFSSKIEEKEFIQKMIFLYKEKVLSLFNNASTITQSNDQFFFVMPNLQFLLKFYFTQPTFVNNTFIVEHDMEFVRFCPAISFWASEDDKIADMAFSFADEDELLNSPPIIVVDSYTTIEVYMDKPIIKEMSQLERELNRKVTKRFPVPIITRKPRNAIYLIRPREDFSNQILSEFTFTLKK